MAAVTYHSPADVARWALIGLGIGADPEAGGAWPVYTDAEPATPDSVITVYNTTGRQDGRSMVDGAADQHDGVQVRLRATDPRAGWDKAAAVRRAMEQAAPYTVVTLDGTRYIVHCFAGIGPVTPLGKESPTSRRNVLTINATVAITKL